MSNTDIYLYVQHVLNAAPPLTEEKRDKLTTLINGVAK